MRDIMKVDPNEIENIKIMNNTATELIATIFYSNGKHFIKTEIPYRNIIKYKEETKENEVSK